MNFTFSIKEILETGDPVVREWPLVGSDTLPISLCAFYVFFVKRLGPALMKDRKPFDLRRLMIVYNFALVLAYTLCLLMLLAMMITSDIYKYICKPTSIMENQATYICACAGWYLYIFKYIEFADTVFFVLRKKYHLITNLHVIHHAILPIIIWIGARSETCGFQFIPLGINSFVHIIMYTYYGLAAMGPEMRKNLWWKEYLTRLQMAQFILILLITFVIVPLFGCSTSSHCIVIDIGGAILFFALFYNFYSKTYTKAPSVKSAVKLETSEEKSEANGQCHILEHLAETIDNCTGTAKLD